MAKKLMGRLEMHADTRVLIAYLRQHVVKDQQEFVSYADLTAAIGGRNVQKEARSLLMTARRNLNRDDGILLVAIQGEGLSREKDVADYLDKTKRHVGRVCRRHSNAALNALSVNGLDNEQKRKAFTELSLLGGICMLTEPKARKQIEARIDANQPKELPTAETLRAQFEK